MKLIMRADDLGISEAVNYGILKTLECGTITSVGLMSNMPAAKQGFDLVEPLAPCLGLHCNICLGTPVSRPEDIPSLVNESGQFYSSKEINHRQVDIISLEECEIELEAQLRRFQELTKRLPDYFEGHAVFSNNFIQALKNVAARHGLFLDMPGFDKDWEERTGIRALSFYQLDEQGLYDPKAYFLQNLDKMKQNNCSICIFHPGYLDQYLLTHSSYTLIRAMECDFLCSQWLQDFIKEHQVTLVDFTNYQN